MSWTDTHCHLQYDDNLSPDEAVSGAKQAGVDRLITVGTDVESSQRCIDFADQFDNVWATVGLHPHHADVGAGGIEELLPVDGIGATRVVGIGECGLDYFYEHSPRDAQRDAFSHHIELAHRYDLALVIHTRGAWDDTFDVLVDLGVPERTVFHCFTGGVPEVTRCLETGAVISFSGIVTFKKADDVREAAMYCPLDRMVVETDSPYLAPVPHRGSSNQPAMVTLVGERIAQLKGCDVEDLAAATSANAQALFRLPPYL